MEVQVSSAQSIPTLDIGRGISTDLVYKLADIYQNNAWQPQKLISSSALPSSNWYPGSGDATIPTSSFTYAVGYLCAWSGTAWKCGCADSVCTSGYWQLQAYKAGTQTTTTSNTTTSNTTTGGTTGQTCSQCDVTITVHSGAVQPFGGLGFNSLLLSDSNGSYTASNWTEIPSNVWTEIFHRLFGPGHFVGMRLFGNADAGELQIAKQQGMTDLVPIAELCGDINRDASDVADVAAGYRSAGLPVTAVSISNKPNADNQTHCARLGTDAVIQGIEADRQALDARGLSDVLVLGPETVEWSPISAEEYGRYTFQTGDSINYLSAIASDSNALAALGAFSTQSYGTAVTSDMQSIAQQHGKPYWVTMNVEPWYDSVQAYPPADSVSVATLLSDLNDGVAKWFYWTSDHLICTQCHPQSIGNIQMESLYYNLTNISGVLDVGAMVRRSESNPALPTADMHFNYGQEPEITATAAKNPDGSWAIALVNLTGVHAMLLNDATYDAAAARDHTVRVYIEELANAGTLTFHQKDSISGTNGINNGPDVTMTDGYLTIVVHPLETVTLVSR